MVQDSLGFLWMGSSAGIFRFDGTNFFVPPEENNKADLSGLKIESLLSHNSNLFVGTAQNGLYVYNSKNQTTKTIGIPNTKCSSIIEQGENLWVSYYNNGIYKIDKNYTIQKILFDIESPKRITSLIYFEGFIFIGTDTNKLYFFKNPKKENQKIKLSTVNIEASAINKLVVIDNQLWVCSSNGLFAYHITKATTSLLSIQDCYQAKTKTQEPIIHDFVKTDDSYFIATSGGLIELGKNQTKFFCKNRYVGTKKRNENSISFSVSNDLLVKDNLLFIGGIILDITKTNKQEVFKNITKKYNLNNPSVFGVVTTSKYYFIGTSVGLLISEIDQPSNYSLLPDYKIRGITRDTHNNVWLATATGAYIIPITSNFEINNPEVLTIPLDINNPTSLGDKNLRSVYKDLQDTIWIITFKNGIYKFTGSVLERKFTFQRYTSQEILKKLPSPFTLSMVQDSYHNYWISTQKGVSKMTFNNNTDTPVFKNYNKSNGLPTNGVLSSYIDSENILWVATRKGLARYHQEKDRFTFYGKKQGLTNTFVYHIQGDNQHNLWISTNGGLFTFNKKTETFANYTPKDGVQSLEFNLGAYFKDLKTGELYFGGINGLNVFDPKEVGKLDKESNIQFTAIKIKDTLKTPNNFEGLNQNISYSKKLTINYDDFPLDISFSAIDFRPNKNIQYAYKLLPDDQQWNALNNKNSLQLLNLAPKKYTLQIQGTSRGKRWKQPPLELVLMVKPPWYRSNLAYFLYVLAFLSIVYLFYEITLQRKLAGQESKRLQDLDELKTRFITNITHEFRTPLTIILGYLGNLKEQYSTQKETIASLETIEKNSNNLLGLVNQMLDLAKLEQGKLPLKNKNREVVAFIKHIALSFNKIAEEKHITLTFISSEKEINMDFDAEKLRQIITNLISNALKFTPEEKKVSLQLLAVEKKTTPHLIIKVKDQGIGIPPEDIPHVFERFYQVHSATFKVAQGTGIGLALTKELVDLMKGSIHVVSEINKGSIFTVQLPITQEAPTEANMFQTIHTSIGKTEVLPVEGNPNLETDNHILIVEDNADMATYISSCLSESYQITHALDGSKGLEKAIEQIPDLIITDVMMPIMDGFEMTQKIQHNQATNHIPIIMLTSKAMQEDKIAGLESGAEAYLTKPFSKKELQIRVAKLIEKRKILQERYRVSKVFNTEIKEQQQTVIPDKNIVFLNKAIQIIKENIDDSGFNSEKLAKELALSESQLYRKLKAISNTSTAIFIRNVRLEKAKELLIHSTLTISEIAYATGFNDPSWFSKAFKKAFGKNPLSFRA